MIEEQNSSPFHTEELMLHEALFLQGERHSTSPSLPFRASSEVYYRRHLSQQMPLQLRHPLLPRLSLFYEQGK